jgi:holo-[acyl-carrier protein] synthase
MNIAGIGIDAVNVERFGRTAEKRGKEFLSKIFTAQELDYAGNKRGYYMHLAGKFAAKEAVKKALPNGSVIGLNWFNIEILNSEDGKPYVVLHGEAKKLMKKFNLSQIFVSISHTKDIAASNALVVKDGT